MALPAGIGFACHFLIACFWASFGLIQCAHNGRFSFAHVIKNSYQYTECNRNLYVYRLCFWCIVDPIAADKAAAKDNLATITLFRLCRGDARAIQWRQSQKLLLQLLKVCYNKSTFNHYTGNSKMALIQYVNPSDLYHMACRMDRGNQFGYNGWNAIGEYLENLSEDIGEDIEADIIAICCDYTMYDNVSDWWKDYGIYSDIGSDEWEEMDDDEKLEAIDNYLQENTSVVTCQENLIIWHAF